MSGFNPAEEAAHAAKNTPDVPDEVIEGQPLGECECGERFEYGMGADVGQLDACPNCCSHNWEKWGYRLPDGGDIAKEVVEA